MKSIVTDGPAPVEKPFPKLMISNQNNIIVLMTGRKSGFVIGNATSQQRLGYYSKIWTSENFSDYTGTVKLSND